MKHFALLALLILTSKAYTQGFVFTEDKPFVADRSMDSSIHGPASRVRAWETLNSTEKDFLYWVNYMRVDPPRFYTRYVKAYLQQFPEAESGESRSLEADMKQALQLPLLFPGARLNLAAADHCVYLAERGTLSHTGRGGRSFQKRMEEAGVTACAGEVIFLGKDDPLVALILLLIDHNVPGLGHRKALLAPAYTRTGVAVRQGAGGKFVFVQDLSCN